MPVTWCRGGELLIGRGACFLSGCCTGGAYFPLISFLTFSDEFHVFVCACICLLYILCVCLELSFVQWVRRFLPRCAFFCYLMFPSESLVSVCLTPCDRVVRYIQTSPVSSIRVPVPFALITVLLLCSAMCFVPRSRGYPLRTLGLPSAIASVRLWHFFVSILCLRGHELNLGYQFWRRL